MKFLQDITFARYEVNNGAGRAEIIALIGKIAQYSYLIKCSNYWSYLLMSGKLKELRGGGQSRKAHNTTTKRTQINVEKRLRWHNTLDSAIDELKIINQTNNKFMNVIEYFIGNLDNSCLMSASGNIYVVASSGNNKTEKISDDCREFITMVQKGFASGQQGAYFFLSKGKKCICINFRTFINISRLQKDLKLS